ncbi:MAG: YwaF family protein [Clostridia bacterium]|nr:YwaF family protein [Clostridia bacterium]
MKGFGYLLKNFFTHKDFIAEDVQAGLVPGTLFTPLHFIFSAFVLAVVIVLAVLLGKKKDEKKTKTVFTAVWAAAVVLELVKIVWESVSGREIGFETGGILPLYPCSVFMYAMPFAIWGKGYVKKAACGYVCTIGFIGASVNFFYPATILPNYSCISFAGFHTFFYHGAMMFCCLVMLVSGYHRYTHVKKWWEPFLAAIPLLIVSIPANIVNFSPINSDYMFFKCYMEPFASIFGSLDDWLTTIIFYVGYTVIPAAFYFPSFIAQKIKIAKNKADEI